MIKETNCQMLLSLDRWYPEEEGRISGKEALLIKDTFKIEERSEISLRNLRDFVGVFYAYMAYSKEPEAAEKMMDKMSAICGVIDSQLVKIGAEV